MTTFAPPFAPSVSGTSKKVSPRVKRANFGDGYSQRARDGLNYIQRSATLAWENLSLAAADEIEAFLEATGGADYFLYTLPDEAVERKWTLASMQRTPFSTVTWNISAEIIEEFDL